MEILKVNEKIIFKINKNEFGILATCVSHVKAGVSIGDFQDGIGKEKDFIVDANSAFRSIIRAQLKEMGRL